MANDARLFLLTIYVRKKQGAVRIRGRCARLDGLRRRVPPGQPPWRPKMVRATESRWGIEVQIAQQAVKTRGKSKRI